MYVENPNTIIEVRNAMLGLCQITSDYVLKNGKFRVAVAMEDETFMRHFGELRQMIEKVVYDRMKWIESGHRYYQGIYSQQQLQTLLWRKRAENLGYTYMPGNSDDL